MHKVTQRGIDRAKTTERYKNNNKSKKLSIDAVNYYYIYKNYQNIKNMS